MTHGVLERLKLRFRPPRRIDPEFGPIIFMYVPNDPAKSYWEAEWLFPPTGQKISVSLPGNELGPFPESRRFMLSRVDAFQGTLDLVRPRLDEVFREWIGRSIAGDVWTDVVLAGFGVEDPAAKPVQWDVGFETKGGKWLGITIPFIGELAQQAVVDT